MAEKCWLNLKYPNMVATLACKHSLTDGYYGLQMWREKLLIGILRQVIVDQSVPNDPSEL